MIRSDGSELGEPEGELALREVTLKLMNAIQQLTGQEYVGRYAPKRPDQLSEPAADV